jgi:hypothetical protein
MREAGLRAMRKMNFRRRPALVAARSTISITRNALCANTIITENEKFKLKDKAPSPKKRRGRFVRRLLTFSEKGFNKRYLDNQGENMVKYKYNIAVVYFSTFLCAVLFDLF